MSFVIAILGLAFLILIHEAGHFFAARAVGMRPRKFYIGFPPPLVKRVRGGVEYGIGAIPLGGYVKIPGMHRPGPGDLRSSLKEEQQDRLVLELDELDAALEHGDEPAARAAMDKLEPELGGTARLRGHQGRPRTRCLLAPDHLAPGVRDRRGTGGRTSSPPSCSSSSSTSSARRWRRARSTTSCPRIPRRRQASGRGTPWSRSRATRSRPRRSATASTGTHGKPFTLVVERDGKKVGDRARERTLRPAAGPLPDRHPARHDDGAGSVAANGHGQRRPRAVEAHRRAVHRDRRALPRPGHEADLEQRRDRQVHRRGLPDVRCATTSPSSAISASRWRCSTCSRSCRSTAATS